MYFITMFTNTMLATSELQVLKVSDSNRKHNSLSPPRPGHSPALWLLLQKAGCSEAAPSPGRSGLWSVPQAWPRRIHHFGVKRPRVSYSSPKLAVFHLQNEGVNSSTALVLVRSQGEEASQHSAQACPRCLAHVTPSSEPLPDPATWAKAVTPTNSLRPTQWCLMSSPSIG